MERGGGLEAVLFWEKRARLERDSQTRTGGVSGEVNVWRFMRSSSFSTGHRVEWRGVSFMGEV